MDRFRRVHGEQLASAGIPERFHEKLHQKLENEVSAAVPSTQVSFQSCGEESKGHDSLRNCTQPSQGRGERERNTEGQKERERESGDLSVAEAREPTITK